MLMVLAMAGLVLASGVGILVDGREVLHESVWLKPFKFGISFVLYGATLAWLVSKLRKAKRFGWWVGTAFAATGLVDVGFIAIQAARGTFSHLVRARLVGVVAFAYAGLMATVTVQAFRGQSLIHPDGQTLGLLGIFAAISAAALALVIALARKRTDQAPSVAEAPERELVG